MRGSKRAPRMPGCRPSESPKRIPQGGFRDFALPIRVPFLNLQSFITDVADFPRKGIVFKDITPLLQDPLALREAVRGLADPFRSLQADLVAGVESRGFIFGPLVAKELEVGFIPVRKAGKLPRATFREEFELEYGRDAVEIHRDALKPGQRVVLVDDVLATGGTAAAARNLLRKAGGEVLGIAFLMELTFLEGRKTLPDLEIHCLIQY